MPLHLSMRVPRRVAVAVLLTAAVIAASAVAYGVASDQQRASVLATQTQNEPDVTPAAVTTSKPAPQRSATGKPAPVTPVPETPKDPQPTDPGVPAMPEAGSPIAVPVAPAPAPEVVPAPPPPQAPEPAPVDQARYVTTNSYYLPMSACEFATAHSTHDPGAGGRSSPSFTIPWSYENMGTYIQFYAC